MVSLVSEQVPTIELRTVELDDNRLLINVLYNGEEVARLLFRRRGNRMRAAVRVNNDVLTSTCTNVETCVYNVAGVIVERLRLDPSTMGQLANELIDYVRRWDDYLDSRIIQNVGEGVSVTLRGGRVKRVSRRRRLKVDAFRNDDCIAVIEYVPVEDNDKDELLYIIAEYRRGDGGAWRLDNVNFDFAEKGMLELCGVKARVNHDVEAAHARETLPDEQLLDEIERHRTGARTISWREAFERVLSEIRLRVVADDKTLKVLATYVIATYFYDLLDAFPMLWLYGPQGSGKTHTMTTLSNLSRHGITAVKPSPASLWWLSSLKPTYGVDENVLSQDAKDVLAGSYKKGLLVPRVDREKERHVVRLFEVYTPKIFSFMNPPEESHLRQLMIMVKLRRGNPQINYQPDPEDFKAVRRELYKLRLLRAHEFLNVTELVRGEVARELSGRELEVFLPIITVAFLAGELDDVMEWIGEYLHSFYQSEVGGYEDVVTVLQGIMELRNLGYVEHGEDGREYVVFRPYQLSRRIVLSELREDNCVEERRIGDSDVTEEYVVEECKPRERELLREYSPKRLGRLLERLGLNKYRRKDSSGRMLYRVPVDEVEQLLNTYSQLTPSDSSQGGDG